MPTFIEPKSAALLFTGAAIGYMATSYATDPAKATESVFNALPYVGTIAIGAVVGAVGVAVATTPARIWR